MGYTVIIIIKTKQNKFNYPLLGFSQQIMNNIQVHLIKYDGLLLIIIICGSFTNVI